MATLDTALEPELASGAAREVGPRIEAPPALETAGFSTSSIELAPLARSPAVGLYPPVDGGATRLPAGTDNYGNEEEDVERERPRHPPAPLQER